MPKYLTENEVRRAVERLGRSSAKGRMCEFLIGVRTLRLAGTLEVAVAESVAVFSQALDELTLWAFGGDAESPYFNPFGNQAGFKSPKFRSNGPSNTMHGWATQSNSPFEILNTRPKSIKRRSLSPAQLRAFLIQSRQEDDRPRLIDAAVWFYRKTDLGTNGEAGPNRSALEARFIEDLALTDDEVSAIFRLEDEDTDDDTGGDVVIKGSEYLEAPPQSSNTSETRSESK